MNTSKIRQAKWKRRIQAKGWTKVAVIVPADQAQLVRDFAEKLRSAAQQEPNSETSAKAD